VIRLADISIRRKLVLITALASGVALLAAGLALVSYDRVSVEGTMLRRLRGVGDILAYNSATAIVFRDPEAAAKTLEALRSDPHVEAACVYTADGTLFARYSRRQQGEACPSGPGGTAERIEAGELVVGRPIVFEGRSLGSLVLHADLVERDERSRAYLMIVAAVSLGALGIAMLIVGRLGRSITGPVLDLARVAGRIADQKDQKDQTIRVARASGDEVGALVVAFNQMLDALQRSDVEIRRTHGELERRIEELDQASRLKDEFLATLSHELRTPLNAIVGWAHLLHEGLDAAATARALETIRRNAMAQSQIVADILDMQRITTGRLRLQLSELQLGPVIERAVDTIRPAAVAKEIEIRLALDAAAGAVLGDEDRLQQVFWNLLSNAVKFTPRHGQVTIALARAEDHVEVTVEDSGPGLDPAFMPFAFDRFRQADSSSTRRHGGLGLGLAIVRSLVESHGGTVGVASRPGAGATFTVRLPRLGAQRTDVVPAVAPAPTAGTRAVLAPDGADLHGRHVLVVDDEPDARELLAAALSRYGASVTGAASAAEGREALLRQLPDVVVCDIEMPDEDGYAFIRGVRRLAAEEGGALPALALTAYAGAEDRARALAAGFEEHLPKPASPAELAAVVARLARTRGRS
jgi:signal transduction histidine kinase/ActR/RegA family two-component response regulator